MPALNSAFKNLLLASLLLAGTHAQATPLHELQAVDLASPAALPFANYKGKTMLLSFFEPDCSWCHRQMKALQTLQHQCGEDIQVLAVGINGDKQALRREVRRAKISYPAIIAPRELLALTGDIDATPRTYIADPEGRLLGFIRGYQSLDKLIELPQIACGSHTQTNAIASGIE
jgi:thioredoxin-related protein